MARIAKIINTPGLITRYILSIYIVSGRVSVSTHSPPSLAICSGVGREPDINIQPLVSIANPDSNENSVESSFFP
ncbi:hypothetical protein PQA67_gp42 [Yersinia phage vB_YenM_56.17]|uniref:Uncharacterized protein n=1 Tax=Yersinia phage vB_YenM_56.17 TaxID=2918927 RepID=A0AAE9JWQ6_9CAUD|nr:hypothetical protein PQA67_gp42 [Yersinia phage vB_YenM_56.17]UNA05930.1 hypothetical protein vBYenM5617_042 [Yersinia phage vB_YenM_56.17]